MFWLFRCFKLYRCVGLCKLYVKINAWIQVDLVEPVSHFLDAARDNLLHNEAMDVDGHKAVNFYCVPLQVIFSLRFQWSFFLLSETFVSTYCVWANWHLDSGYFTITGLHSRSWKVRCDMDPVVYRTACWWWFCSFF